MRSLRPLCNTSLCLLPALCSQVKLTRRSDCLENNAETDFADETTYLLLDKLEPSGDLFYIRHPAKSTSHSSFSIMYDSFRRSPKWVVEHLRGPCPAIVHEGETTSSPRRKRSGAKDRRRPSFHSEKAIDVEKFRTKRDMYKHSGYDRGETQ